MAKDIVKSRTEYKNKGLMISFTVKTGQKEADMKLSSKTKNGGRLLSMMRLSVSLGSNAEHEKEGK